MYAQEKSRHFTCIIDENESLLVCFCDKATELKEMDTWKYYRHSESFPRKKQGIGKEWNVGVKESVRMRERIPLRFIDTIAHHRSRETTRCNPQPKTLQHANINTHNSCPLSINTSRCREVWEKSRISPKWWIQCFLMVVHFLSLYFLVSLCVFVGAVVNWVQWPDCGAARLELYFQSGRLM